MNVLLISLEAVFLYCILAVILKVPSFSSVKAYKGIQKNQGVLSTFIDNLAKRFSPYIKLSIMKKNKIIKLLVVANDFRTAEEFVAKTFVVAILPLFFTPIIALVEPLFCLFLLLISVYLYRKEYNLLRETGEKRNRKIESEILKFVMYMSNALKSERNIITCIEGYINNFDTPLTEELIYTVSDMKTGNYENALRNMEYRNNSSTISKLTRGLLSAMHGDEMNSYFNNLGVELSSEWEENLKRQALLKEPQISKLSYILFGLAIVTVFIIMITALTSSNMLMGGF